MTIGKQELGNREIMDIRAAATYLGISRSHLSHLLAGKVAGVPAIPHVRAGRRALIRRTVIDRWLPEHQAFVPPVEAMAHDNWKKSNRRQEAEVLCLSC